MKDCIFCKIARKEIPSKKIYENNNFFSMSDIKPMIEGHSLVISKRHYETTLDMPSTIGAELLDCIKKTSMKLMGKFNADGINVLNNNFESAGQIVHHAHFHILPRKKGDNFKAKDLM